MPLVQKFIVEDVEKASSILPQHIALVDPDGNKWTGVTPAANVAKPADNTGDNLKTAVDGIIDALVASGLMSAAAEESVEVMSLDVEPTTSNVPTESNTVVEIDAWAQENNIDLTGCSTKAEKLAKIAEEVE